MPIPQENRQGGKFTEIKVVPNMRVLRSIKTQGELRYPLSVIVEANSRDTEIVLKRTKIFITHPTPACW